MQKLNNEFKFLRQRHNDYFSKMDSMLAYAKSKGFDISMDKFTSINEQVAKQHHRMYQQVVHSIHNENVINQTFK